MLVMAEDIYAEYCFELPRILQDAHIGIQMIGSALNLIRYKRKPLHISIRKQETYIEKFRAAKNHWKTTVSRVFHLIDNRLTIEKLAFDVVNVMYSKRTNHYIPEEFYEGSLKRLVKVVVGNIMDEDEISAAGQLRQKSRLFFLNRMIMYKPPTSSGSVESGDIIDICEISNDSQMNSDDISLEQRICARAIYEAIRRFCRISLSSNFIEHIYHIINITYVIEAFSEFLKYCQHNLYISRELPRPNMMKLLQRTESDINSLINNVGPDCKLKTFEEDLRTLSGLITGLLLYCGMK